MTHFVIIGINYRDTPFELNGCENDARFYEYNAILLEAEYTVYKSISGGDLSKKLYQIALTAKKDDTFYFCFSGSGTKVDGKNAIVLYDGEHFSIMYIEEIKSIFDSIKCRSFAVFDTSFDDERRKVFADDDEEKVRKLIKFDRLNLEVPEPSLSYLKFRRKPTAYLYASRDKFPAIELGDEGAFTYAIKRSWKKAQSFTSLVNFCRFELRKYQQNPRSEEIKSKNIILFKSNEQFDIISKGYRNRIIQNS